MKKVYIILITVIGLFVLAACASSQEPAAQTGDTAVSETMNDNNAAVTEDTMSGDDMMADNSQAMAQDDEMMANDNAAMTEDTMSGDDMMANDNEMTSGDDMMDDTNHDNMAEDDTMMSDTTMDDMTGMADWQNIELTDARTGETFTLASFSGKTVYVEPMATWCTNCRQQLGNVRAARAQVGDDVVFIGLSLETNLSDADLAQYQSDQGFDWTFAVMTPEMLQSLADTFGRSITSAPSTPHFVIRPDGSHTDLVTGIDSTEQIVQFVQSATS
jgi:thiol-disulfide isomerase/thioredoxin